jgi:hypothetical protein
MFPNTAHRQYKGKTELNVRFWLENLKTENYLKEVHADYMTILPSILDKCEMMV